MLLRTAHIQTALTELQDEDQRERIRLCPPSQGAPSDRSLVELGSVSSPHCNFGSSRLSRPRLPSSEPVGGQQESAPWIRGSCPWPRARFNMHHNGQWRDVYAAEVDPTPPSAQEREARSYA